MLGSIYLCIRIKNNVRGFAFSCFWGILEMHQQEKRVLKGWFPENPKRHDYYEVLRQKKGYTP